MSMWIGLGTTQNQPYNGWSDYIGGGYSHHETQNPKFVSLFADTFSRIRMISSHGFGGATTTYPNASTSSLQLWASYIKSYKPSEIILYGSTNNHQGFNPQNYAGYRSYLQQEAQWAQDNAMDYFCIGNENLIGAAHQSGSGPMTVATLSRASNVATATFSAPHGLTTGDYIFVSGATPTSFNVTDSLTVETVQCTVIDTTTITYPNTGVDESATGSIKMNWSTLEIVRKTKVLGVDCQAIFIRGPIVYSESQGWESAWITLGITPGTDIDLFGINSYGTGQNEAAFVSWKAIIDSCWAAFGSNLIVTELNVLQDSGNVIISNFNHEQRGAEEYYDREIIRRVNYCKNLGITQVYLYGSAEYPIFCNVWPDDTYGNRFIEGDYKPIVDKLAGNRISRVMFGTNEST